MVQKKRAPAILIPLCGLAAVAILAASGCNAHHLPDELARAVNMGERPVAMKGAGTFFGGKVLATVTISRGIGHGLPPGTQKRHREDAEILDVSEMEKENAMAYAQAKYNVGSPMPPVTIHLRLTDLAKEPLAIEVRDFESDLGNFAVHPAIVKVNPEQTVEPDPMISQLGVSSDDIPVKVSLKVAGKTESVMISVKNLLEPPPADQK